MFCTEQNILLDENQQTYNAYNNTIHDNIPDRHTWTEERVNVQKHPVGTIGSTGAFLTLAQAW